MNKKYIIVLGDGMADRPLEALGGKTPLAFARTPHMDALAARGRIGLAQTIPAGMAPGSDVANLSVMGYDPRKYYSGRSPLEALSLGVEMDPEDVAIRANLVCLEPAPSPEERVMADHSAGEISTGEALELVEALSPLVSGAGEGLALYGGTSYRHCLLWKGGSIPELMPPHDILERPIGAYLPREALLRDLITASWEILDRHPVNLARRQKGLRPANSLWFWGAGRKPALENFAKLWGLEGAVVSAVDLLRGIARGAGMAAPLVEGATGGLDTNYQGKVEAALQALYQEGRDFVYIHLEAPDEMGHQGHQEAKVEAIERLDARVLGPLWQALEEAGGAYAILLLPDHPTPLALRTHSSDPVPFALFDSGAEAGSGAVYSEEAAAASGWVVEEGHQLLPLLLGRGMA